MLFMVIERFKEGDPLPVYRRFRDHGRLAPADLAYVASWVANDLQTCYQLMEGNDASSLEEWMKQWRDLVDFDVVPVLTSAEAFELVKSQL
jgi:hypothetical protein